MEEDILKEYSAEKTAISLDQISQKLATTSYADLQDLIHLIQMLESKEKVLFEGLERLNSYNENKMKVLTLVGVFHAHKNGFGFVRVDETSENLFIDYSDTNYAIDGDRVEVVIKKVGNKLKGVSSEARIIRIIERSLKTVVGRIIFDEKKSKYAGYIKIKNKKIRQPVYIKKTDLRLDGTEVLKVVIERYPHKHQDFFVASLLSIVGHIDEPGIDVLEVLESMDIITTFPKKVLDEVTAIPEILSHKDYEGRLDLRNEVIFTIDGVDAKDLDDAIHVKQLENGHIELGVHIADVSYYVKENSELDKEALNRGTSVYVTDRVVPMLPERLSNGICSLSPNVDRLTQSCIMEIDEKGCVVHYQLVQTIINTIYRMTYDDVNDILGGDKKKSEYFQEIVSSIEQMVILHKRLEHLRRQRGSLDFTTHETKFLMNKQGKPVDILSRQRGIADRMIESFMLVANETVAKHFAGLKVPFIYRVHDKPKFEEVQKFIDYASTFGIKICETAQTISQKRLQKVIKKISETPYSEGLSTMLLRSMQQAYYSKKNIGHYGLATKFYSHFTSPLRRYPDLLVHRLIREYGYSTEITDHFGKQISKIANQSSQRERRAIEVSRYVESMKKAEYMEEFVGQQFEGVISSVVKFGIFVELSNTIEGLIHITDLNDFYQFNDRTLTLKSKKSGIVFRVGQSINIRLKRADKITGEIDFEHLPSELDIVERKKKKVKRRVTRRKTQKNAKRQE